MKRLICLFLIVFSLQACGYTEGTLQRSEKSYLQFTGNTAHISVQIDDRQPFTVAGSAAKSLYQVPPGKHSLKVYRDGRLVVDRILLLDNQTTMEVQIP